MCDTCHVHVMLNYSASLCVVMETGSCMQNLQLLLNSPIPLLTPNVPPTEGRFFVPLSVAMDIASVIDKWDAHEFDFNGCIIIEHNINLVVLI